MKFTIITIFTLVFTTIAQFKPAEQKECDQANLIIEKSIDNNKNNFQFVCVINNDILTLKSQPMSLSAAVDNKFLLYSNNTQNFPTELVVQIIGPIIEELIIQNKYSFTEKSDKYLFQFAAFNSKYELSLPKKLFKTEYNKISGDTSKYIPLLLNEVNRLKNIIELNEMAEDVFVLKKLDAKSILQIYFGDEEEFLKFHNNAFNLYEKNQKESQIHFAQQKKGKYVPFESELQVQINQAFIAQFLKGNYPFREEELSKQIRFLFIKPWIIHFFAGKIVVKNFAFRLKYSIYAEKAKEVQDYWQKKTAPQIDYFPKQEYVLSTLMPYLPNKYSSDIPLKIYFITIGHHQTTEYFSLVYHQNVLSIKKAKYVNFCLTPKDKGQFFQQQFPDITLYKID